jgi:hypothetical protein
MSQAPFTIVRPVEGAKIRETVRVLIPKNSVPKTGYVGFFLDGKFMEAVVPNLQGRYYEYMLNTKAKDIADGKHTLEAVLYVDYSDEPRIVDRSSINVTVQNKANIPIPAEGLQLRYKFRSNEQYVYNLLQRVSVSTLTKSQAQLGGKAAELPLDYEKIRMLYAVDNAYGNGDGLIRMQPQPLKNKKYAMFTVTGASAPQLFWDTQMHAIYMRLTNTGMEVFGSIPAFVPFEGVGSQGGVSLLADYPLPTLPVKRVRPGDIWASRFQMPKLDLQAGTNSNSLVESYPARGEFQSLEWEMGHPCAKLHHTLAVGSKPAGGQMSVNRASMDETLWFALDKGMVIKVVRNISFDTDTEAPAGAQGGRAGGGGGKLGNSGGDPNPGRPGVGRGGKGGGGGGIDFVMPEFATPMRQFGGKTGRGGQGRNAQGGQPGRITGTRTVNQPAKSGALVRLSIQQIFILEQ